MTDPAAGSGADRPGWLRPALILLASFCGGVQLAFIVQMFRGANYFAGGAGSLVLKFGTLGLLLASVYLLLPLEGQARLRAKLAHVGGRSSEALARAKTRLPAPARAPAKPKAKPTATPATGGAARASPPAAPVRVEMETPLAKGPVWPPGEPIPITINIRVEGGAGLEDVDVELDLQHARGTEKIRVPLRGDAAVLSQTIPEPGPFTLTARALRAGSPVGESIVEGIAASYREEIGRRFEALKASAADAGLAVGAESTPREVRNALARRYPQLRANLDDLVAAIEVALYSQDEIGRDTYERLVRALSELERKGLEAAARA